jgi:YfiH family protein
MLVLTAANLEAQPDISHGFFGRSGGVSEGPYATLNCGPGSLDARANVIENRRRVAAHLSPTASLVTCGQVHGTHVITVAEPWPMGAVREDDKKLIPVGDAMVTKTPDIGLGILTADCAPILFSDREAGVIGAAHAGWKGALAGVVETTLAAMESLGAKTARIAAAIGPAIGQPNYEVGPEFLAQFRAADSGNARFFAPGARADHYQFDLEAYVTHRLRRAGVSNVVALSACTYARESDFYSYRRATHRGEADNGRHISAIVLRK